MDKNRIIRLILEHHHETVSFKLNTFHQVCKVLLDPRVFKEQWENRETQDHRDHLDPQVQEVSLGYLEKMANQDVMEKEVQWDPQVHQVKEAYLVCPVCLVLRDIVVSLVSMEQKEALALPVKKEKKDHLDHPDPQVQWDLQGPVESVGGKVPLVHQV